MKFQIIRTSNFSYEDKPCEGTQSEIIPKRNGHNEMTIWTKEFSTLEDLISFQKEQGDIIISDSTFDDIPYKVIEIYDYYRE